MKPQPATQRDIFLVAQIAVAISVISFFYCLRHDYLLLYGDAVAHINIARRVFDSRTPGLLQLGTVWLPLPHLLMLPFLIWRKMWQTGIGGSIPSLVAYVLSVVGIYRLVDTALSAQSDYAGTRFAAWLAAGIFAANPNLVYLQTTAMTETVYLCLSIWTIAFFVQSLRGCAAGNAALANSALVKCGICLLGACLTRYDGWILAAVLVLLTLGLAYFGGFRALRPAIWKFSLLAAAGPILWLAYNAAVYRNPLEFANGPYSAKAIELKSSSAGVPHPGTHNLPIAFQYFFKSAEISVAPSYLQPVWVAALLLGTGIVVLFQRRLWPLLLLWIPVAFHMVSIAYGGVPIFIPSWWPFSFYNSRYGLEMLPAFAVLTAIAAYGLIRFAKGSRVRLAIEILFIAIVAASYVQVFHAGPVAFREARLNSRTRGALQKQLASIVSTLPADETYLMYVGDHVGMFQRAAIPLSHVINEGNHRPWKQPSDPDGLWEKALAHPASYADVVIAFDSDPVAATVNKSELNPVLVLHVTGQPSATLYRTEKSNQTR